MKLSLEKEEKDLEEKRALFLKEKQLWEESNKEDEDKLKHSLDKEYVSNSILGYTAMRCSLTQHSTKKIGFYS